MMGDKMKYMGLYFHFGKNINKSYFKRLIKKKKEHLNNGNSDKKYNFKLWIKDVISNPSKKNVTFIIIFNILLFGAYILPNDMFEVNTVIFELKDYTSIISVLMTVVLGLLIFSAESLRDKYSEAHSVLLNESKILFITITLVFHLLFSLIETLNILIVLGTLGLALITLYSLYKVIMVLSNKTELTEKRKLLLSNLVIKSVDKELDRRIGNNVLFEFIQEQNLNFIYSSVSLDESEQFYVIKANTIGTIIDIDLSKLKHFSDKVNNLWVNIQFINSEQGSTQPTNHINSKEDRIVIYFNKLYNEKVNEYDKELIRFMKKKELIDERSFNELESIALSIFKIENENNIDDIIKTDLMYLKDEFITSIRNGHIGKIEVLKDTYIFIAEEFLKKLKSIGGVYNSEQARNERTSLNGKFEQLNWLSYDLRDILREAFNTNNELLIRLPMYIPTAISNRAILYNDHLLFQEFVEFSKFIYYLTETADFKIKKFIIDRISMHIRDSFFYFKSAKKNKESGLDDIFQYGKYYFKVLQDLLKACYDNNDEYGFNKFYFRANKLSDIFHINYNNEEFFDKINKSRLEMYYGLRSWMFWDILEEGNKNSLLFFDKIKVFENSNLKEFIDVYINMNSNQNKSYWGRSWWEFDDSEEETSIWIKEDIYDDIYFVYQCLVIISKNNYSEDNLPNPQIFTHEEIIFKIRYEQGLLKIISDYRDKFTEFDSRIKEETVKIFLITLETAKKYYEELEKSKIRLAEMSTNRIKSFKSNFIKEFHETACLRGLIKNYIGSYFEFLETTKEEVQARGINQIEDKSFFIEDTNIFINEFGTNYARSFAENEDLDIMMKITSANKYTVINLKAFYNMLNDCENLFIITNLKVYYNFFADNKNVINNWQISTKNEVENLNAFEGKFVYENKEIPIFLVRNLEQDGIYIFDKSKFGKLVQYSPRVEETVDNDLIDIFSIKVDSYSQNKKILNNILQNPPNWLIEKGDKLKQSEYLKEYVRIMIYENYEFVFDENFVGYILNIEE